MRMANGVASGLNFNYGNAMDGNRIDFGVISWESSMAEVRVKSV